MIGHPPRYQCDWVKYRLNFRFEARTSRDVMTFKDTYFVRIRDTITGQCGIGECNLFKGLSADDTPDFEARLTLACQSPHPYCTDEFESSAINFGFETAMHNLLAANHDDLWAGEDENDWIKGKTSIPINGLIWMGDRATMAARIKEKLNQGFRCLKLKIGGIKFEDEVSLLDVIRSQFAPEDLEIRLDANGAFTPQNAMDRLDVLAQFHIHSIEQPIKAGQWMEMAQLCINSPIPIALDEELIGIRSLDEKYDFMEIYQPQFVVLKPALCGGLHHALEWIQVAIKRNIGFWVTSALESNVGLAAIARWISSFEPEIPQGLGTGQLYTNNIPSPLFMDGDGLRWDPNKKFDYAPIGFQS